MHKVLRWEKIFEELRGDLCGRNLVGEEEKGVKNAASFWQDAELCLIARWVHTDAGIGTWRNKMTGVSWCAEFAVLPTKKPRQANRLGCGSTP